MTAASSHPSLRHYDRLVLHAFETRFNTSALTALTAKALFRKHFGEMARDEFVGDAHDYSPPRAGRLGVVDWAAFATDLAECPAMAYWKCGEGDDGTRNVSALWYAVVLPDVPPSVIEELLRINPEAIGDSPGCNDMNIFEWITDVMAMMSRQQQDQGGACDTPISCISPQVLRLLCVAGPKLVACLAENGREAGPLIFRFVRRYGFPSAHVTAILESSRQAVASLLQCHFEGSVPDNIIIPPKLVMLALECAEKHDGLDFYESCQHYKHDDEREQDASVFTITIYNYHWAGNVDFLAEDLFKGFSSDNVGLLHQYLKAYVTGQEKRRIRCEDAAKPGDEVIFIDKRSLTSCLLMTLSKVVPRTVQEGGDEESTDDSDEEMEFIEPVYDRPAIWSRYMIVCGDDSIRTTTDTIDLSHPIIVAIQLGFQFNLILRDILDQDMRVLDSLVDVVDDDGILLQLPLYMVAAMAYDRITRNHDVHDDDKKLKRKQINAVNTTYEILRANPSMLRDDVAGADKQTAASWTRSQTNENKKQKLSQSPGENAGRFA